MPNLQWTRRKPKSEGWYWLAAPTGFTPRIVKAWRDETGRLRVNAESPGWHLLRPIWKGCRWAGPLVAPEFNQ